MRLKSLATALAAAVLAALVSPIARADAVKIGSKNFTEQFVVAEIYAQALEKAGIPVERHLNLGATLVAHTALMNGDIDLYPEYTGTALASVVKGDLSGSPDKIYSDVKDYYEKNLKLTLLQPTQINNGYAIITLPETAEKYKLKSLSDLGPVSKDLTFGAEGGFGERKDGLPGLKQTYGIEFKEFKIFAKLGCSTRTSMSLSALRRIGRFPTTSWPCWKTTSISFRLTIWSRSSDRMHWRRTRKSPTC
jgi:osmoprotectant transport system substrate-binding protein